MTSWLLSYHNNYNKAFFRNKGLIYICPVAKGKNNKMGRTRSIGNLAVGNTQGGRQNLNFFLFGRHNWEIFTLQSKLAPLFLSLYSTTKEYRKFIADDLVQ